jgi:uroporphyrinogen decarboxylase
LPKRRYQVIHNGSSMQNIFWPVGSAVEINPDFTRLDNALHCKEPDRVPLLELFHDLDVKEAFLGHSIENLGDDIQFHIFTGYDYYTFGLQYKEIVDAYDLIGVPSSGPASSVYGKSHSRNWVPEKHGLISSRKEFEAFNWPTPGQSMIMANVFHQVSGQQAINEALKLIPQKMKLILQTDGIFERFTKMMGLETFSYLVFDDPALIAEIFKVAGEMAVGLFEYMADQPGVGALWLADDLAYASDLITSPNGAGKPLIFHSDGNLLSILPDLIEIGFNALQPIEPKAMDIHYLKQEYGKRLCLIGNIDLGSTLTLGNPDDVAAEVKHRIRDIGPGGGYCVGSSNTVTNYVPLDNFKAMVEATFHYGKYPILIT